MSASDSTLLISIQNGVAELTMNRPEVNNAFDDVFIQKMINTLAELEQNSEVRVLVLKGAGKHFSAGADLAWMQRMAELDEAANKADAQQLSELMHKLDTFSKPTLAVVQGASYGGAVGLISCCDMAIASDSAVFCLSEVKIGLSPAVISPYVIRAIGSRQARRYFISAEVIKAEQALAIGLVHELVDKSQLQERADKQIQTLLKNSPQAMAASKKLIQDIGQESINDDTRNYCVDLIASIRVSDEGQEGLKSFLNKRQPAWITSAEVGQ